MPKGKGIHSGAVGLQAQCCPADCIQMESGSSVPSAEELVKISEVLDVSVSELLKLTKRGQLQDLSDELEAAKRNWRRWISV